MTKKKHLAGTRVNVLGVRRSVVVGCDDPDCPLEPPRPPHDEAGADDESLMAALPPPPERAHWRDRPKLDGPSSPWCEDGPRYHYEDGPREGRPGTVGHAITTTLLDAERNPRYNDDGTVMTETTVLAEEPGNRVLVTMDSGELLAVDHDDVEAI